MHYGSEVLHVACLVISYPPFVRAKVGSFGVYSGSESLPAGSLGVAPLRYFEVSSCFGPGCGLLGFPFGPFHEVHVISEGETSIVLQTVEDEVR
jgi:hypothetical protein